MARFRDAPTVWTIGGLNLALLLVVEAAGGSHDAATMLRFGAQPNPLERVELWRLVTSGFLHFGTLHLLLNLWALAIFGPVLERSLRPLRFAALYAASLLAGSAASAAFTAPPSLSAGASGAIFGLLGAYTVIGYRQRHTPHGQALLRQAVVLLALNVLLGVSSPSIGLEAHLGGLVGGAVVMAAQTAKRGRRWGGLVAAAVTASASVAVAFGAAT